MKYIKGLLLLIALTLVIWLWFVPWLGSHRNVTRIFEDEINAKTGEFAEPTMEAVNRQNQQVYNQTARGTINQPNQREAMNRLADAGYGLQQIRDEALNRLHGRTFGDVHMPVTTDVDDEEPVTWFDTGKVVCEQTRIEVWGTATHDPEGYALYKWVGPLGWQDATPEEAANFHRYAKEYKMLAPEQPFMAALGRLGLNGEPFIFDEPGPEEHYQKTVVPQGCQKLYMSVNGFTRLYDFKRNQAGIHLSDLARQRQGGFELKVVPLE